MSEVLSSLNLEAGSYVVASLHREENVDNVTRLASLLKGLDLVADRTGKDVILSVHPRTRKRLAAAKIRSSDKISFHKPFGFFDYLRLQRDSYCVISDSGTIAEEASMLDFPAISPRDWVERPEGLDTGCFLVVGASDISIAEGVDAAVKLHSKRDAGRSRSFVPDDYLISNTSERVCALILGGARMSNDKSGIRTW